jgi:signal transduction histidine kinase
LGKHLTWTVKPEIHIRGDRELLMQAFVNLIENSLRHTPPGAQIGVSLNQEGGQTVAVINDNGPGIPIEQRKNVFRRFYRLEASRSTLGSGLGLALVAAIAHLHGAEVLLGDNGHGLKATLRFESEKSK